MTYLRTRNRVALGLVAGALTALLAACGDSGGDGGGTAPPPKPTTTAGATQVNADLADFRITLSRQSFDPGRYAFVAKNTGQHQHALEIEGPGGENKTRTLQPGESTTLTVTLASGTYTVYCPVDGHKDRGMKTEITVAGAPGSPGSPSSPNNGY
ncbi:plastocyanin/azurin family copper-binding protein [Streptomyces sp. NPDC053431]|uniref:plastocyanin/azurin family copper-binding protein n=1 Tax=Streptomyces sp. NPDC053431 TaxID=3365703 RepID=UPI0037D7AC01